MVFLHVEQAALPLSPSLDSIAERMLEGTVCGVLLVRVMRCSGLRILVICHFLLLASAIRVVRSVCMATCTQRMPPGVSGGLVVFEGMGELRGM